MEAINETDLFVNHVTDCLFCIFHVLDYLIDYEDVKIGKNRKKDAIHFMGEISLFMVVAHDDN